MKRKIERDTKIHSRFVITKDAFQKLNKILKKKQENAVRNKRNISELLLNTNSPMSVTIF